MEEVQQPNRIKILHIGFMFPLISKPSYGLVIKDIIELYSEIYPGAQQFFGLTYYKESNDTNFIDSETENLTLRSFKVSPFLKYFQFFPSNELEIWANEITPTLIHFHNFFPGIPLLFNYFQKKKIKIVVSFRGSCLKAIEHFYRNNLLKLYFNKVDFIHFNSPYYAEKIKGLLAKKGVFLDELKMKNIPNFLPDFWNETVPKLKREKIILIVGGAEKRKNLFNLFKAIGLLKRENLSFGYQFHWYGQIYDKEVFQKLNPYLRNNTIEYKGVISQLALKKKISQSSGLISIAFEETFGMVYAEAISQNTPILYTSNSGFSGYIKYHPGVIIDDVSDSESIKEAIIKLIIEKDSFNFKDKDTFSKSNAKTQWNEILTKILLS